MGRRMTCPACGARTSSVVAAFESEEGSPCPSCGLPHAAAVAVIEIKARQAGEEVTQRAIRAELRAAQAENELRRLRRVLTAVKAAVLAPDRTGRPFVAPEHPSILDPDADVESYTPDVG
jgi:hypothetical protein